MMMVGIEILRQSHQSTGLASSSGGGVALVNYYVRLLCLQISIQVGVSTSSKRLIIGIIISRFYFEPLFLSWHQFGCK